MDENIINTQFLLNIISSIKKKKKFKQDLPAMLNDLNANFVSNAIQMFMVA